jgi:hypothetical protein
MAQTPDDEGRRGAVAAGDGNPSPPQDDTRDITGKRQRRTGPSQGEDPAAGTVESPVAPDQAQPGDRAEEGARRGGPVDVSVVPDRGGVDRG